MAVCYISLGSNLGDRRKHLGDALQLIGDVQEIEVRQVSSFYETTPAGGPTGQHAFLNAAAELATELAPEELLVQLQNTERRLGRRRQERWDSRTVDLDLLFFDQCVVETASLRVPHPRMHFRRFVLEPLAEIAPQRRHPELEWTVEELSANLRRRPLYLALAGTSSAQKTALARRIAQHTSARIVFEPAGPRDSRVDPPEPPRQPSQIQLEWWRLSKAIESQQPDPASQQWLLSDFWLEQHRLPGLVHGDRASDRAFRRVWRTMEGQVLKPTLVVWLDGIYPEAGSSVPRRAAGSTVDAVSVPPGRTNNPRVPHLDGRHPAPILQLRKVTPQEAYEETMAAMQAASG